MTIYMNIRSEVHMTIVTEFSLGGLIDVKGKQM